MTTRARDQRAVVILSIAIGTVLFAYADSAVAVSNSFVPVPLGYAATTVTPVDIDGDGRSLLAVYTAGDPPTAGLFDALAEAWIDGPRALPPGSRLAGVVDLDGDGHLEYISVDGDSAWSLNTAMGQTAALFPIAPHPGKLLVTGGSGGAPAYLGILYYTGYDSTEYLGGFNRYTYVDTWLWRIYSLGSGALTLEIPGGAESGPILSRLGLSDPMILVYRMTSRQVHYMMPTDCDITQSLRLMDAGYTVMDSIVLPPRIHPSDWVPYRSPWGMPLTAACNVADSGTVVGAWGVQSYFPYAWGLPAYIGGYVLDGTGITQAWQVQIHAFMGMPPKPLPYGGMAINDFDEDGDLDLLLPISGFNEWEVRDAYTGVVTDTVPDLPSVNLQTAALLSSGREDLYYWRSDTLYLWKPGIVTDVADGAYEDWQAVVPSSFVIHAYPNPFNSSVRLSWPALNHTASIEITNILGQRVRSIEVFPEQTTVEWNSRDHAGNQVPSGVYFARMAAGNTTATVKIVLLR